MPENSFSHGRNIENCILILSLGMLVENAFNGGKNLYDGLKSIRKLLLREDKKCWCLELREST